MATVDPDLSTARTVNKGHGRIEIRTAQSCEWLSSLLQSWGFGNAKPVVRVERVRKIQGEESVCVEYYLTSLETAKASAFDLLKWIRAHWAIENQSHHSRDVTWDEDHVRVRKGGSAEVLAALRNATIHLMKDVDALSNRAATQRFQIHPEEAIELLRSEQSET